MAYLILTIQDPNHPKRNASYLHHTIHEDFDKEMAGSVVDTAAIHGLREEMELEFAIHKEQVHTHGSVNGEKRKMYHGNFRQTPKRLTF